MGNSVSGLSDRYKCSEHFSTLVDTHPGLVEAVQRHAQCGAFITALTTSASNSSSSADGIDDDGHDDSEDREQLVNRVNAARMLHGAGVLEGPAKVRLPLCV